MRYASGKRVGRHTVRIAGGVCWLGILVSATRHSDCREPEQTRGQTLHHSENFSVISRHSSWSAKGVAVECERLRDVLHRQWCTKYDSPPPPWIPRAVIFVHASEAEYLREVGWEAALTRGRCKIEMRQGKIQSRRIDLMADPGTGALTALAHELTHAVLADRSVVKRLPRWADEGIALWADPPDKKSLHRQAVQRAIDANRIPRVMELLLRSDYPASEALSVFYGQSLSLVEFLLQLDEPQRVLEFAELGTQRGYAHAVRQVYAMRDMAELERRWLASVRQQSSPSPPTIMPVGASMVRAN